MRPEGHTSRVDVHESNKNLSKVRLRNRLIFVSVNLMQRTMERIQDRNFLLELARTRMPFGKHQGMLLVDLPEPYVVWFAGKGFPQGKLGQMLAIVHEIKVNGLEYLFREISPRS